MPSVTKISQTFGRAYTSNIDGSVTATKVYCVMYDASITSMDEVVSVALAGGLPALGSVYNTDSGYPQSLVAVQHTPIEIDKEQAYYNIQIQYETSRTTFSPPTQQPWIISFNTLKEDMTVTETKANAGDATGLPANTTALNINVPVVNLAGYPFDPTVLDLKVKTVMKFKKNFENITDLGTIASMGDLIGRVNTVNDDVSVTIAGITFSPLELLLDDVSIVNVEANGEYYYAVEITIIYDPQYHVVQVLNAGWQNKLGNKILGEDRTEISQPWPLDVNGDPIRGGAAARIAGANYVAACVKGLSTFSALGLPTAYGSQGDLPIT